MTYNPIAETDQHTVVAEYTPAPRTSEDYQSEAELEQEFIRLLGGQGYERLTITSETALIENLRCQLESLNHITFTDGEWKQFFDMCIAKGNEGIVEKSRKVQDDYVQVLRRDDGSTKNIYLLDKKNIHNNSLQVLNQYEENNGTHGARYDVTILVNGLPLIHVELKRRGVAIKEAFNQIARYQRDSFWAASGMFEYVQIFVISNGTNTKYYSNTTRASHIKKSSRSESRKTKKTSDSFEFTSYWADGKNRVITDLVDFTKTFFAKHAILKILTRYCVFTSEELLLVMRPYQIAATERILERIHCSTNYKKTGTIEAGGYIWHTTGSGKTLTSFKTAQLATEIESVEKVLFIVDRKDLDYQTMKEYDRFQKDSANSSKSTKQLEANLTNPNAKIIITTIQKLDIFISKHKSHDVYQKHVVIIFDECHRSQFGDMHRKIVKAFQNYHVFGFTGTPIFTKNASNGGNPLIKTTAQVFGGEGVNKDKPLHAYTIVNAINDENVLPFRIDFINTIEKKENSDDKQVLAIDTEKALSDPIRVAEIVKYIIEHFDQKTYRNHNNSTYTHKIIKNVQKVASAKKEIEEVRISERVNGFNSIFAVSSIPMAKKYYEEFRKQLAEQNHKLNIATIFSYAPNEDILDDSLSEEEFENDRLDKPSRDFLESAISDYNAVFKTSYDTSSDKFQNYYKDLSLRMKNREIDLLIVVNMFLTGFDATTLNTLWVDKNLKYHGLIQAFSRTNRILNSIKVFGNIVCFRDLITATDEAISLFGNEEAGGIVRIKTYEEYYYGYVQNGERKLGYVELIEQLTEQFPLGEPIISEESKKEFIRLYGMILKLKNILSAFDDFKEPILSDRDFQDYQSIYIDFYQELRPKSDNVKESINDDIIFELELIQQIEVNIDYILILVEKYHDSNCEDKDILTAITKAVDSSIRLRSKKELIERFVEQVNVSSHVTEDWQKFVQGRKEADLSDIIADEKLKDEETHKFVDMSFRDGALRTTGIDIDKILPCMIYS
jgi:type I restriction enzyme R subunit